jgi:hypothetical protein
MIFRDSYFSLDSVLGFTPARKMLICFFLVVLLFWMASPLYAQNTGGNESSFKSNVKTNVLALFSVAYEGAVAERKSLLFEFRYSPTADLFDKGLRIVAASEMRFYLDKIRPGLQGFYLGPYLKYRYMEIEKQPDMLLTALTLGLAGMIEKELRLHTFGFGGQAGYQWIFRRGMVLNAFGGLGYNPVVRKSGFMVFQNEYRPNIRLGFSLGIAIPAAGIQK